MYKNSNVLGRDNLCVCLNEGIVWLVMEWEREKELVVVQTEWYQCRSSVGGGNESSAKNLYFLYSCQGIHQLPSDFGCVVFSSFWFPQKIPISPSYCTISLSLSLSVCLPDFSFRLTPPPITLTPPQTRYPTLPYPTLRYGIWVLPTQNSPINNGSHIIS